MKIIVNNVEFPFDLGCHILKLKHKENCPMEQLQDFWDEIVPLSFKEIAQINNLEQRRVGILYLGIENIISDVKPKLLSKETLEKSTLWVDANGELTEHKFNDTYELYEVDGSYFNGGSRNGRSMDNCYYIRCNDTSTDREYLIWIDLRSVWNSNTIAFDESSIFNNSDRWGFDKSKINAIHCIAWTIQTDVPIGSIEKIVRQGDCIMIKPKRKYTPLLSPRHLSEKEYTELLIAES
jgi:hypothetical protein